MTSPYQSTSGCARHVTSSSSPSDRARRLRLPTFGCTCTEDARRCWILPRTIRTGRRWGKPLAAAAAAAITVDTSWTDRRRALRLLCVHRTMKWSSIITLLVLCDAIIDRKMSFLSKYCQRYDVVCRLFATVATILNWII